MLKENVDITDLSWYQIPATADYYFEYTGEDDIADLIEVCGVAKDQKLPILVLSGGTNMLIAFDRYPGIIIHNTSSLYDVEDKMLYTQSGCSIWDVAQKLEDEHDIDLWHRFIGLPGSIGWAIYGNAWCFWLETENNFVSCMCLNMRTGHIVDIPKNQMKFGYRKSKLKKNRHLFCLSAVFDLSKKVEKYHSDVDNIDFRENKQPKGLSCGSFFKNPSREQPAGLLIEEVGLKGHKIWGAFFSDQHANFLMSDGTATHADMLELIQLAQKKVEDQYGIQLENEVQIIGTSSGVLLS